MRSLPQSTHSYQLSGLFGVDGDDDDSAKLICRAKWGGTSQVRDGRGNRETKPLVASADKAYRPACVFRQVNFAGNVAVDPD